jgi:hypothetical protein
MSAAAFFYAGTLEVQWQLLIVVILLFFSTLAFFAVLFDDQTSDISEPLLATATIQDEQYTAETGYQNYPDA